MDGSGKGCSSGLGTAALGFSSGGAWPLVHVLQELEHARACFANFLQVDLVRSKAVEEAVQADHPIVPFPGNCVDGGLSLLFRTPAFAPLESRSLAISKRPSRP